MKNVVNKYREAAIKLYGISERDAERTIYAPEDDPGEWAPDALAIINFETGHLPACSPYAHRGLDECFRLAGEAGVGFVEWINAAVGAVYE